MTLTEITGKRFLRASTGEYLTATGPYQGEQNIARVVFDKGFIGAVYISSLAKTRRERILQHADYLLVDWLDNIPEDIEDAD